MQLDLVERDLQGLSQTRPRWWPDPLTRSAWTLKGKLVERHYIVADPIFLSRIPKLMELVSPPSSYCAGSVWGENVSTPGDIQHTRSNACGYDRAQAWMGLLTKRGPNGCEEG